MNKWQQYEFEKRKLQAMDLTSIEYEKAIENLIRKLNI